MPAYFDAVLSTRRLHGALRDGGLHRTTSPSRPRTTRPITRRCSTPICSWRTDARSSSDGRSSTIRRSSTGTPSSAARSCGRSASYGFPMTLIWQNLARNVAPKIAERRCRDARGPPRRRRLLRPAAVRAHRRRRTSCATSRLGRRCCVGSRSLPRPSTCHHDHDADRSARLAARRSSTNSDDPHGAVRRGARDASPSAARRHERLLRRMPRRAARRRATTSSSSSTRSSRRRSACQRRPLLPPATSSRTAQHPGYVANVLALFQREPGLGLVFPPMIHIGYSDIGPRLGCPAASWRSRCASSSASASRSTRSRRSRRSAACSIARPEALRLLIDARLDAIADYARRSRQAKATALARLQERLVAVCRRRARLPLPHRHERRARRHQPHRSRVQDRSDVSDDARVPRRADPVPAPGRVDRARRHRRPRADVPAPQPPATGAASGRHATARLCRAPRDARAIRGLEDGSPAPEVSEGRA